MNLPEAPVTSVDSTTVRAATHTTSGMVVTTIACLLAGEEGADLEPHWRASNPDQETLLRIGEGYRALILQGGLPIETIFSDNSDAVTSFFAQRGITLTVTPCKPDEFAMGALMKLGFTWTVTGDRQPMYVHGCRVRGARIKATHKHNLRFFEAPDSFEARDFVGLTTSLEGEVVYFVKASERVSALTPAALFDYGIEVYNARREIRFDAVTRPPYTELLFPKAAFDLPIDLSYCVGLRTTQRSTGRGAKIVESIGYLRGHFDELGGEVIEAVAMKGDLERMVREPPPNPLIIDGAYVAIVTCNNVVISVTLVGESNMEAMPDETAGIVNNSALDGLNIPAGDGTEEVFRMGSLNE